MPDNITVKTEAMAMLRDSLVLVSSSLANGIDFMKKMETAFNEQKVVADTAKHLIDQALLQNAVVMSVPP